ncbi:Phosphopantetheine adenylyltransferase [Microlunatus sagamiharensis]|uniref:Phosphopantetheine adenylyltransferase n=1 Tax=Microlunatus sagamiharensis TaxID=546874 RepID=A0A1H2LVD7_9ACTN|nr:pantetheine-phosphate adenylyltransferase [Microlunatus sagamiharensis]SDU84685.1 Phosphopantetheine adenylyltransferase [Microlunatus sagamiharensis]
MTTAACPGSFDPVTLGHLDVIGRTAALVEHVVVAVGRNASKRSLFSAEERVAMLREVCAPWPNVTVELLDGMLVDFCTSRGITVVSKGLRSAADTDYEVQMAQLNRRLSGVDTLFLATSPELSFVSSTRVRELAAYGADLSALVPPLVAERTRAKVRAGS